MVDRHHEHLRRSILKIEDQCRAEGLSVPFLVFVAEAVLAKTTLVKVAGQTPYRGLYGREPPELADFERNSTMLQAVCAVTPINITAFASLP